MSDTDRKLAVFPAFHKVAGRRVVVVGGGHEAAAKIRLLSETKAEIVVFARALDKETGVDLIAAHADWRGGLAGRRRYRRRRADLRRDRLGGGRPRNPRARQGSRRPGQCRRPARALRFLHTGYRQPRAACRGGRQAKGVAPVLSRHVRARIEALLAPSFGDLAGLAERLRAARRQALRRRAPIAAASGHASFPGPSPRRSSPARSATPSARRSGRSRPTSPSPATSRWSAPVPARRTC